MIHPTVKLTRYLYCTITRKVGADKFNIGISLIMETVANIICGKTSGILFQLNKIN